MAITNYNTSVNAELDAAAQKLMNAAYEYWKLYQQHLTSAAVVWVDDNNGHFVLFTRGEYKDALLSYANIIANDEPPLEHPFEARTA